MAKQQYREPNGLSTNVMYHIDATRNNSLSQGIKLRSQPVKCAFVEGERLYLTLILHTSFCCFAKKLLSSFRGIIITQSHYHTQTKRDNQELKMRDAVGRFLQLVNFDYQKLGLIYAVT